MLINVMLIKKYMLIKKIYVAFLVIVCNIAITLVGFRSRMSMILDSVIPVCRCLLVHFDPIFPNPPECSIKYFTSYLSLLALDLHY